MGICHTSYFGCLLVSQDGTASSILTSQHSLIRDPSLLTQSLPPFTPLFRSLCNVVRIRREDD